LSDKEKEVLNEKRERVKKKDMEEMLTVAKGVQAKGQAKAPTKAPQAAQKGKKEEIAQPVVEDEYKTRVMPAPENHVNVNILAFLNHFKCDRLIEVPCDEPDKLGRKRSDSEKLKIAHSSREMKEE
jgi:hypothetical protein